MESLNLKAAAILITIGTVLLIISVSSYQSGGLACTLTQDACAQVAAQEATVHFFEYLLYGLISMSIAVIFLITGRSQEQGPPVSPS